MTKLIDMLRDDTFFVFLNSFYPEISDLWAKAINHDDNSCGYDYYGFDESASIHLALSEEVWNQYTEQAKPIREEFSLLKRIYLQSY